MPKNNTHNCLLIGVISCYSTSIVIDGLVVFQKKKNEKNYLLLYIFDHLTDQFGSNSGLNFDGSYAFKKRHTVRHQTVY